MQDSISEKSIKPQSFRVGLVGAGYISEFHLRALRRLSNVSVVGIADLDISRAQAAAERFGIPRSFPSLRELAAEGLDVVHVLTPPAVHAEVATEALGYGCHVLVEKPLATNVEDSDRIASAASAANRRVCVDHSLLYDFFVARALNLVRDGAVGHPIAVDYFCSSAYPPYRGGPLPPQYHDGGYPFRDVGAHALYLIDAFLGKIQKVDAEFATQGGDPNLLYDEWRAIVKCERGTGHAHLSWNVLPKQHLLMIQGTRGVLRVDLVSMTVTLKRNTPLPKAAERALLGISEGFRILTQVPNNSIKFVRKRILQYHGLQMLVAEFYRTLSTGEPTPVPVEKARPIVEWIDRMAREADEAKCMFLQRFPKSLSAPVLVTGASGFIGSNLVRRLLREGRRIRVFVRREPRSEWLKDSNIEICIGDLGDPGAVDRAVAGAEVVYHVGGAMRGGSHEFERGIVVGTRNVVESVLRYGVKKMVYVSSLSVLWSSAARKDKKITEDWPLEPNPKNRGDYSQMKREAEELVVNAVREKRLPAVILRPGKVIGPESALLSLDIALRKGSRLLILGNGSRIPPLVYVDDVVDAIVRAEQNGSFDGSTFHIVDSNGLSQNEIAKQYLSTVLSRGRISHLPVALFYGLAFLVEVLSKVLKRPAPLSIYKLRSLLAPLSFDCSAAEQRLGWRPMVGVRAGLQTTLAALRTGH
jgi:predicted dehydrogenase/nucleoside-diphosphate-sugar epimerase